MNCGVGVINYLDFLDYDLSAFPGESCCALKIQYSGPVQNCISVFFTLLTIFSVCIFVFCSEMAEIFIVSVI